MRTLNPARPARQDGKNDGPGLIHLRQTIAALPGTLPGTFWKRGDDEPLRDMPDRDVALVAAEIAEAAAEHRLGCRPSVPQVAFMVLAATRMRGRLNALCRSRRRPARVREKDAAPRPMRRRDGRVVT